MSVFYLFADLASKKEKLKVQGKLDKFPFNKKLFVSEWSGKFPDYILRINETQNQKSLLRGGEMIELKDSKSGYTIASFNSTIPSGSKRIASAGEVELVRNVYYLVRGRKQRKVKVCLISGSFFETIDTKALIKSAFSQALSDASGTGDKFSEREIEKITEIMANQRVFSKTRRVDKASVSLRFRVMTETYKEANILNADFYPEILDDTLNFIIPTHGKSKQDRESQAREIESAAREAQIKPDKSFFIKHPFNGYFLVLQIAL